MSVLEYVLDGLEKALELERELGVRTIEFDRELLKSESSVRKTPAPAGGLPAPRPEPLLPARGRPTDAQPSKRSFDLVFVHHRPLTPNGNTMIAKAIVAMERTAETTPVIVAPPLPKANVYVVLGGLALKTFFPGVKGGPNDWCRMPDGAEVLITYSPDFILRFGEVTPAVKQMKQSMWQSLKAAKQRIAL